MSRVDEDKFPAGIAPSAKVQLRARLAPPPPMALPNTYDFARDAWFPGVGAVGKSLGPITVASSAPPRGLDRIRENLRQHISPRLSEAPPASPSRWSPATRTPSIKTMPTRCGAAV